jgi:CheY-like chemotaxis protein
MDGVEILKFIRSQSDTQSLPVFAFSNPYLGGLTRAASESGATRCITKTDASPDQLLELIREVLSVSATSAIAQPATKLYEKLAATLMTNAPETLSKLRANYRSFARTEDDDSRRNALSEMHRQLRLLAGGAGFLGLGKIAQMATALEALLIELHTKPQKITPSVIRTVAHAVDILASLFDRAANPQPEVSISPKILVVDDEIISREAICSALGKAGLPTESVDDALAAQRLLEQNHFDLIFLDVEMPGQSGLELCVKIRKMSPNRATPVVFVTSHSDFGSRAQSTLSGGNDFIAKPFLSVELAVKTLTWLFRENVHSHSTAAESSASVDLETPCHEPRASN